MGCVGLMSRARAGALAAGCRMPPSLQPSSILSGESAGSKQDSPFRSPCSGEGVGDGDCALPHIWVGPNSGLKFESLRWRDRVDERRTGDATGEALSKAAGEESIGVATGEVVHVSMSIAAGEVVHVSTGIATGEVVPESC